MSIFGKTVNMELSRTEAIAVIWFLRNEPILPLFVAFWRTRIWERARFPEANLSFYKENAKVKENYSGDKL